MILDHKSNLNLYEGMGFPVKSIGDFIEKAKKENLPEGRYELDGQQLFAMIQVYQTRNKQGGLYEAHKKYIDIQYILEGKERMYVTNVEKLNLMEDRRPEQDNLFYEQIDQDTELVLGQGDFSVFYPTDAHLPCCMLEKPETVKKIVFKWKIGE